MDILANLQSALSDRYRVERQIGVGGMATVYLARDLRHDRNVALKLLKPELGAVLGVERFLSEIRVTANLQHPHLLPLFDSGEADGLLFYVMPYVEGESLRHRMDRETQLPVNDAVRIAVAVAGALDYAHRRQVVHRDLKPENILLQDGQPVVSDFGIALAVTMAGGTRVTQSGLSLGTPQYMSPEQATGNPLIDARSDIYSLAAVLYEMLIGEPPHSGANVQAIVARVITDKPRSVRATREMVPENVDAAITTALAKLPADRFATAQQFAEALQDSRYTLPVSSSTLTATSVAAPHLGQRVRRLIPWALAAAATVVAVASLTRPAPEPLLPPPALVDIIMPDSLSMRTLPGDLALSNDGKVLVMVVRQSGVHRIAVRRLDDAVVRVLPGTDDAARLFLSPDGATVGFFVDSLLRTVPVSGGGATRLVIAQLNSRATWGDSGIVYSNRRRLFRITPSNGQPIQLTAPDSGLVQVHPSVAPGGRLLVMLLRQGQGADSAEIAVVESDGRVRPLGVHGGQPQWIETGHVLFNTADGNLMALPVDRKRLTATGVPLIVRTGIRIFGAQQLGAWAAAPNGTVVFHPGGLATLGAVDRHGTFTALTKDAHSFRVPRLSPDGNRVAIQIATAGTDEDSDIWIFDRRSLALSRFTKTLRNSDPAWASDERLAFSHRDGDMQPGGLGKDIYWQDVRTADPPELLYSAPGFQSPRNFTPDGKTLVFDEGSNKIRTIGVGTNQTARDLVANEYKNGTSHLSFDGKWLAYVSDETGRGEVYVRPFTGSGRGVPVSADGGTQPRWSWDGRELFFRDATHMIAATMLNGTVTARSKLFEDRFTRALATDYDVTHDGGFLMLQGSNDVRRLTVMMNWATELRRLSQRAPR